MKEQKEDQLETRPENKIEKTSFFMDYYRDFIIIILE